MPVANATISDGTRAARRATAAKEVEHNPDFVFIGNANVAHAPLFWVGIFNVSDRPQKIERPWCNYNPAQRGKIITVPAIVPPARVSKPFLIPDVVQIPIRNISNGEMDTRGADGKFLAQDAINPEDPRGSWKTLRPENAAFLANESTNLYHYGLFWEVIQNRDDPPSDAAVNAAIERLETQFNRLIEEAKAMWMGGPENRRQIGPTHRWAASHFELEFEWNQVYRKRTMCEGCGSQVIAGIAVCPHCNAVLDEAKAKRLFPERFKGTK